MIKEGNYAIQINPAKKEVGLVVVGTFTPEKAQAFVNDYNKKVNSINASEYKLVLDCHETDISSPTMVPELQACFELYKQSGFNEVVFEISNNPILKMQFNRLIRNVGLTNGKVVVD